MRIDRLLASLAVILFSTGTVHASIEIQAGDYIYMTRGPGGNGGVFDTQETNAAGSSFFGDVFPTFCVEVSEHISLPGKYYVQSLSFTASQSGNVLTDLAGWIYADYLDGLLPNQAAWSSQNLVKFNNSVQVALWYEVLNHTVLPATLAANYIQGGTSNYNSSWVTAILGTSYSGSNHGVRIMNLRSSNAPNAGHMQDQLVRNTPEAASWVAWTLLFSCAAMCANRRRDE